MTAAPSGPEYDVAVIGAGVVGCAVARQLARSGRTVVVVERADDVGTGTSKANTAILHTGFDAVNGSVEATLVRRGYGLLREYAARTGISVEETGAVLVAWTDEQLATLPSLVAKAERNGYHDASLLDAESVRALEPHLGPGPLGGVLVPGEHVIDPWSVSLAHALEAIAHSATFVFGAEVGAVEIGDEVTTLSLVPSARSRRGVPPPTVIARHVVNAAGLHGDVVHRRFGCAGFTIRPRRGELIVFDKLARRLVTRTILPVPTATTKGVLVAPTVFGNVMLGPTADDIDDFSTATTTDGLARLLDQGRRVLPALLDEEITATYAGLRAATEHSDYQISAHADARYVALGGIRSTGLSASMALAEEADRLLDELGALRSLPEGDKDVTIAVPSLGWNDRPLRTPADGRIVCHCEQVGEAALKAACSGPLPAVTVDGLRRRSRALNGRCQGFFCSAAVAMTTGFEL